MVLNTITPATVGFGLLSVPLFAADAFLGVATAGDLPMADYTSPEALAFLNKYPWFNCHTSDTFRQRWNKQPLIFEFRLDRRMVAPQRCGKRRE